jgi:hypothetical protein
MHLIVAWDSTVLADPRNGKDESLADSCLSEHIGDRAGLQDGLNTI